MSNYLATAIVLSLVVLCVEARNDNDLFTISGEPLWIDARDNDFYYKETYTGAPFPLGVEVQDAWKPLTGLIRNHNSRFQLDPLTGAIVGNVPSIGDSSWPWEDRFSGTDGGRGVPENHAAFPDGYGTSVLLREDRQGWAFIAAPTETVASASPTKISGAVYVYRRRGAPHDWRWQFHQKLTGEETPTGAWNGHNIPGTILLDSDDSWLSVSHQRDGSLNLYRLDDSTGLWLFTRRILGAYEAAIDSLDNRLIYRTPLDSKVHFTRLDPTTDVEPLISTISTVSSFFYQRERDLLYVYDTHWSRYDLYRPWLSGTMRHTKVSKGDPSNRALQCATKDRLWVYYNSTQIHRFLYDVDRNTFRRKHILDLSDFYTGQTITSLSCSDDWLLVGSGSGNGSLLLFSSEGDYLRGWNSTETRGMAGWSLSPRLERFLPIGFPLSPQAYSASLTGGGFSTLPGHVDLYSVVPWFRIDNVTKKNEGQWTYDDLSLVRLAVHDEAALAREECLSRTVYVGKPLRARSDYVALWKEETDWVLVDPVANDMVRGIGKISLCFLPDPHVLSLFSILPAFHDDPLGAFLPDDEAEFESFSYGRITSSGVYLLSVAPTGNLYRYSGIGIPEDPFILEEKISLPGAESLDAKGKTSVVGIPSFNSTVVYVKEASSITRKVISSPEECTSSFGSHVYLQTDSVLLISCLGNASNWMTFSIDLAIDGDHLKHQGRIGPMFVEGSQGDTLLSLSPDGTQISLARRVSSVDQWHEEQAIRLEENSVLWAHVGGGKLALLLEDAKTVLVYRLRNLNHAPYVLLLGSKEKRVHLLGPSGDVLYLSPSGTIFSLYHNDSWIDLGAGSAPESQLILDIAGEGQIPLVLTLDDSALAASASVWPYRPLIKVSPFDRLVEDTTTLCYYLSDDADDSIDRGTITLEKDAPPLATMAPVDVNTAFAATPVLQRASSAAKLPDWAIGVIVALAVFSTVLMIALVISLSFLLSRRRREEVGASSGGTFDVVEEKDQ